MLTAVYDNDSPAGVKVWVVPKTSAILCIMNPRKKCVVL
jgi:hypothetical protein